MIFYAYTLTTHTHTTCPYVSISSLISDMLATMKYATTLLLMAYATAESPVTRRVKKMKYKKATRCMKVTTTGTSPGPIVFNGLAAAGTYVSYGTIENSCSEKKFLFDIGRGTTTRLSELGVRPTDIDALFITHLHSDHVDDLSIFMNYRWFFTPRDDSDMPMDIYCSNTNSQAGPTPTQPTMDCNALLDNIDAAYHASGEIELRRSERPWVKAGGPSAVANVTTFPLTDEIETIYNVDEVKVQVIRTTHINGQASYRVVTPAGNVVIAGDASNDETDPELRPYSTNDNVEKLAGNATILVHSAIHPIYQDSGFPAKVYNRQSSAPDISRMAKRAEVKKLIITHLMPPLGADAPFIFPVPGGRPLGEKDWIDAVTEGGFDGAIYVGKDLMTVQIEEPRGRKEDLGVEELLE
jgi:ribonuclease Z